MTATVLGAGGVIGGRLVAALRARGEAPWTPGKGDAELFRRDLGVVYYCAGLTADYDRRPFDTVAAHVGLLNEILRAGRFERIVYCSSTRLYDGLEKAEISEAEQLTFDPADPRGVYYLSKALGENLTLTRSGGRGAVARLANVYDWRPGASGFLSEWLLRASAAREITLDSSPHIARDYIHLDDAVDALTAMAAGEAPGIVNVASGELVTNGEVARVFEAAGWTVRFTVDAAPPPPPPNARIDKLVALGVTPRPVRNVVAAYLAELAA